MKHAVIDIGSNTIKMTVSAIDADGPRELFSKKRRAGLALHSLDGTMSRDGVDAACRAISDLRASLDRVGPHTFHAFATASLRGITNRADVLREIASRTGVDVEVISGEDEALYSLAGARHEIPEASGTLVDIGGGSTEIASFDGDDARGMSFAVGALALSARFMMGSISPKSGERERMIEAIRRAFDCDAIRTIPRHDTIYAVGGAARAARALANEAFGLGPDNREMTLDQLRGLRRSIARGTRETIELLNRTAPSRARTMYAGTAILTRLMKHLGAHTVIACSSGIRDGYLRTHCM